MTASLQARKSRDEVVRQLNAAGDAGDRDREDELLAELARIEFEHQETTAEPTTLDEEQEQALRETTGVNDGIDTRSIPRANVRDVFHRAGWYRPRMDRLHRPHPRRVLLPEASLRRFRLRRPRPRRLAGSRSSSKDSPSPSGPELAPKLLGTLRMYLDAWGIWRSPVWARLAAEALAEREIQYFRAVARETGFAHIAELVEVELERLGSSR